MQKKKITRNGKCIGVQLLCVDELLEEEQEEDEDGVTPQIIVWVAMCGDGNIMAIGTTESEDSLFSISQHYSKHLGSARLDFMKEGEWYTL